jgi:hypothetical protein
MFSYYCKRCEVTGRTPRELPDATCWCCERTDGLVPETFSLAVRRSEGQVVTYYPSADAVAAAAS